MFDCHAEGNVMALMELKIQGPMHYFELDDPLYSTQPSKQEVILTDGLMKYATKMKYLLLTKRTPLTSTVSTPLMSPWNLRKTKLTLPSLNPPNRPVSDTMLKSTNSVP